MACPAGGPRAKQTYKHIKQILVMEPEIGVKVKSINLNNHIVSVVAPKKSVSYEEGVEKVDKIIKEIKEKRCFVSAPWE